MMRFFNRNRRNNSKVIATTVTAAAATILTLAIIFTLTTTNTAATSTATSTNTTSNTSSPVIELSPQPIYQGYSRTVSQAPINETHISATDSGNGTLTLPETGERVNVTTNGSGLFSLTTGAGQGEVTIRTQEEDGSGGTEKSATSKFYQIVQANFTTGEGKGLMIAITHTNSTGVLAPLNGTIATGIVQFQPNGQSNVTLWGWQSGIPLPTGNNDTTTPSSGLELSAQPVWVEHAEITGVAPINDTHSSITYSGNGTLTLPNTTQTINTTSNGSALVSIATESGQGKVTIRTQDGEETATVTFYEIDRHPDITTGEGKGIVIAVINTNTTSGMLAPLNGMILVGINEFQTSTGEGRFTLWEWKS